MRRKAHVRFGGRAGETGWPKGQHRAPVRPYTDREGNTLELEADHRRHAEIENTIQDVKYGMALNPCPRTASPPTLPGWAST
jgi:hypothetical protein